MPVHFNIKRNISNNVLLKVKSEFNFLRIHLKYRSNHASIVSQGDLILKFLALFIPLLEVILQNTSRSEVGYSGLFYTNHNI